MKFDEIRRTLQNDGSLRAAANSREAARLLRQVDPRQVEQAARQGDAEALKRAMSQILSTPEGQALAERVRRAVEKK